MRPQWSWVSLAPLLMHCITVYVGNFYWAIGIHFAWNMFAFLVLEGLYTGSLKDAVKLRLERKEKVKVTKYKSYNYDQHKNLFTMQAGKGQVYGLTLYNKYVYHVPVTCSARDFTKLLSELELLPREESRNFLERGKLTKDVSAIYQRYFNPYQYKPLSALSVDDVAGCSSLLLFVRLLSLGDKIAILTFLTSQPSLLKAVKTLYDVSDLPALVDTFMSLSIIG